MCNWETANPLFLDSKLLPSDLKYGCQALGFRIFQVVIPL
jgi:hypothetical protein